MKLASGETYGVDFYIKRSYALRNWTWTRKRTHKEENNFPKKIRIKEKKNWNE